MLILRRQRYDLPRMLGRDAGKLGRKSPLLPRSLGGRSVRVSRERKHCGVQPSLRIQTRARSGVISRPNRCAIQIAVQQQVQTPPSGVTPPEQSLTHLLLGIHQRLTIRTATPAIAQRLWLFGVGAVDQHAHPLGREADQRPNLGGGPTFVHQAPR